MIGIIRIEIVSHTAIDRKFFFTYLNNSVKAYNAFFGNEVLHGILDCLQVIGDMILNFSQICCGSVGSESADSVQQMSGDGYIPAGLSQSCPCATASDSCIDARTGESIHCLRTTRLKFEQLIPLKQGTSFILLSCFGRTLIRRCIHNSQIISTPIAESF